MKPKGSQLQRVRYKLLRDGFITRNECLSLAYYKITRLSQYIMLLRREWGEDAIETTETNADTIYKLVKRKPKIVYDKVEVDGQLVAIKREIPQ